MNDVSTDEIRMMSIVGLLVTAVVTTVLTMALVSGGAALGRLIRQARDRRRAAALPRAASPGSNQRAANGHVGGLPRQPSWISEAGGRRSRGMRS